MFLVRGESRKLRHDHFESDSPCSASHPFRAARLVGARRGVLQTRIKSGELATFEGMVSTEDLLRVFPEARLEDNAALERFEAIKDAAFVRRMRERLLPSSEVLVARLAEMGRERALVEAELERHRAIVAQLQAKLRDPGPAATSPKILAADLLDWLGRQLEWNVTGADPQPLRIQENFLRIMTAHVEIKPSGSEFFVDGNESVLEAALRAGLSLDYGCSSGSCGKCKARIVSGQVHRTRHSDFLLSAAEKSAGIMLMCCNTAVGDLVIEAREAHSAADMPLQSIDAKVKSVTALADDLRLLHLQTPRSNRLRFLAGQSVSLTLPDGPNRRFPWRVAPATNATCNSTFAFGPATRSPSSAVPTSGCCRRSASSAARSGSSCCASRPSSCCGPARHAFGR